MPDIFENQSNKYQDLLRKGLIGNRQDWGPQLSQGYSDPNTAQLAQAFEQVGPVGDPQDFENRMAYAQQAGNVTGGIKYSQELGPQVISMADSALNPLKKALTRRKAAMGGATGEIVPFEAPASKPQLTEEQQWENAAEQSKQLAQQRSAPEPVPENLKFEEPAPKTEEPGGQLADINSPQNKALREALSRRRAASGGGLQNESFSPLNPSKDVKFQMDKADAIQALLKKGFSQQEAESIVVNKSKDWGMSGQPTDIYDRSMKLGSQRTPGEVSPNGMGLVENVKHEPLPTEGEVVPLKQALKNRKSQLTGEMADVVPLKQGEATVAKEVPGLDDYVARFQGDKKATNAILKMQNPEGPVYQQMGKGAIVPNFKAAIQNNTLGEMGANGFIGDPFAWTDMKYGISKNLLGQTKRPITINTGSDLIGHSDYIQAIPKGSVVNMWFKNLPETEARHLFPGSPSDLRLKQAADRLEEAGIKVNRQVLGQDALNKAQQESEGRLRFGQ